MSDQARDDLVAAMEAFGEYDAMPRADRTGLDEATVMLTALTFLRNHGKHLLALLDAEPVDLLGGTQPCVWEAEDCYDYTVWDSTCGESWYSVEGDPNDNDVRYCHGCGRPVKVLPARPEASDE